MGRDLGVVSELSCASVLGALRAWAEAGAGSVTAALSSGGRSSGADGGGGRGRTCMRLTPARASAMYAALGRFMMVDEGSERSGASAQAQVCRAFASEALIWLPDPVTPAGPVTPDTAPRPWNGEEGGEEGSIAGAFYRCSEVVWQDPTASYSLSLSSSIRAGVRGAERGRQAIAPPSHTSGILEWLHQKAACSAASSGDGTGPQKQPPGWKKKKRGREEEKVAELRRRELALPRVREEEEEKEVAELRRRELALPRPLAGHYPASLEAFFTQQLRSEPSAPTTLRPAESIGTGAANEAGGVNVAGMGDVGVPPRQPLVAQEPSLDALCDALEQAAGFATDPKSSGAGYGAGSTAGGGSRAALQLWEASRLQVGIGSGRVPYCSCQPF